MATLEEIFDITDRTCPGHYGPTKTALLLLDFHTMFVQKVGGPGAVAALETAVKLREWAKYEGIQVIHCLIDIHGTPFTTCKGGGRLASIVTMMNTEGGGEEPAELLKDVEVQGSLRTPEMTFIRTPGHVSALKSPGLEEYLQEQGIVSLILAGISTSGCVLRTSLASCDAEYVVTVISDACADPQHGVHDVMVKNILNNRGHVTTAAEFQQGFPKALRNSK